jgi:putative heme-binding domain-containing protein
LLVSRGPSETISDLGHPNHFAREQALEAAVRRGERAVKLLGHAAETADPLAAANAIWALTRLNSPAAAQAMTRALEHPDARVRAHALRQLRQAAGQTLAGEAGPQQHSHITPAKLAKLAAPFLQDPDSEVRVEAALAQDLPAAVTQGLLAALATAPDRRLLSQIGMHLARRGDAASVLALVRSTNSDWQRAGLIALDTARYEQTPLAASVQRLEPQALEEVPPPEFVPKLAWLQRHKPELLAAEFARLDCGELRLTTAAETLATLAFLESSGPKKLPTKFLLASLESADPRIQEAALRVVRQSAGGEEVLLAPTLKVLRSTESTTIRLEAIFTLGTFGKAVSTEEWLRCLQHPAKEIVAATLRALRQAEHPPEMAEAVLAAAPALATREPEWGEDVWLTLNSLGIQADQCGSLPVAMKGPKTKSDLRAAVLARLPKASATLGRLSFHSARTGCAQCHSSRPGESAFGPSLADIGAAAQPEHLIESILEPSKVIKTGFQTETIETTDGRVLSGLVEVASGKLIVKISPDEQVAIPLDPLTSRAVSQLSSMPEGLEAAMSEAEMADLVAFLASLKTTPQAQKALP